MSRVAATIGDGREQPIEVFFINTLWEEGDDSEEVPGRGAKLFEHRRGERELDGGPKTVASRPKHARLVFFPLPG